MRLLLALPALLVLTACGPADGGPGAGQAPPPGGRPVDRLVVEQDLGDGSPPQRWTLVCGTEPGGDHPQAAAACAHLAGLDDPFAPLPEDLMCAQVYGGPQTARVTGTWGGRPVDLALSRTDACHTTQWEALGPLLPGPIGPTDPQGVPQ